VPAPTHPLPPAEQPLQRRGHCANPEIRVEQSPQGDVKYRIPTTDAFAKLMPTPKRAAAYLVGSGLAADGKIKCSLYFHMVCFLSIFSDFICFLCGKVCGGRCIPFSFVSLRTAHHDRVPRNIKFNLPRSRSVMLELARMVNHH
jgi:hypothetical protein